MEHPDDDSHGVGESQSKQDDEVRSFSCRVYMHFSYGAVDVLFMCLVTHLLDKNFAKWFMFFFFINTSQQCLYVNLAYFLLQVSRREELKKSLLAKLAIRQSNLNPERPG